MTSHRVANLAAWDAAVLDARRLVARAQKCRAYQDHDTFDNYNNASLRYETVSGTVTFSSSYARFPVPAGLPNQGIKLASGSYIRKNMQSNQQTLICKIAYYQLAAPSGPTSIIGVLDSGAAFQVALCCSGAGALQVQQGWQHLGGAGLQTSTGPSVIAPLQWYNIEVLFTISNSVGVCIVYVNGFEVINATNINTNFTGDNYANQVQLGDSVNPGCYMDDFRVWDNTGSSQNELAAIDTRLLCKLPSGAGALTQLTPNGAAANWQCVDDNPPDGDTTYVSGSTAGLTDAYAVPVAGLTQPPLMVVARTYARKDDSATRSGAAGVNSGGHSSVGPTVPVNSTYAFLDGCIANDPNTSSVWTAAGADAAQVEIEEIA